MIVTLGQQYSVGEKPTVILKVVIIGDNSAAIEPYTGTERTYIDRRYFQHNPKSTRHRYVTNR